jgi:hypothetical protein
MNNSESSQPNEWNVNPSNIAHSPPEYADAFMARREGVTDPLPQISHRGGGGRLQDRATRLSEESEARPQ